VLYFSRRFRIAAGVLSGHGRHERIEREAGIVSQTAVGSFVVGSRVTVDIIRGLGVDDGEDLVFSDSRGFRVMTSDT
jgi:hypothetical protein